MPDLVYSSAPNAARDPEPRRTGFGILTRRERWGLSWKGWLLLVIFMVGILVLLVERAYPFLAVTERVPADVMVVEGWVPLFAIRAAAHEFTSGGYKRAFVTGGPVQGSGAYFNDFNTAASVGAKNLKAAGVPDGYVQMVPCRVNGRDRTYSAAVALREWFYENNFHPPAINVLTEGPHARRTRLLFQEALGTETKVGIIAVQTPDYDPKQWWRFSEGVKDIETEALGYLYARLFFHPPPPQPKHSDNSASNLLLHNHSPGKLSGIFLSRT